MDRDHVKGKIKTLLQAEFSDVVGSTLSNDDDELFYGEGALNSFTMMSLVVKLESIFEVSLYSSSLRAGNFISVNEIADLVMASESAEQAGKEFDDVR